MADKDSVEKYLENNPQFAKEYFDKKLRAEGLAAAFSAPLDVKDTASFKDVNSVQEAAVIFELVQELQKQGRMEESLHKVMQRVALILQADRVGFYINRARNGIPELSSCLFDVTPTSKFEINLVDPQSEIVFPLDMGIVGFTANSKKALNIPDVSKVREVGLAVLCGTVVCAWIPSCQLLLYIGGSFKKEKRYIVDLIC